MTTIDFSPLYRSTVGFDRLASLLDSVHQNNHSTGYPPYNIEATEENEYAITIAVAGFGESELDIQTERGVLTVRGEKAKDDDKPRNFLYQGIATRTFERKFQLADHVEVVDADLSNGMLTISLVKEIPEAMKPKRIAIGGAKTLNHDDSKVEVAAA
jgi:molecular chaperone IbpA